MTKHPNYEILEVLGRGENSVVYRAWDVALSRDVAIKEVTSEPGSDGGKADAERISQFLKEASFLAQFEHENVLRIHTVDQERGWIVMELMKGSLANQIAAEPMPADTVRSVVRQVLNALDFLHQKDKVHGAVRPSNILINDQGAVRLSDFEASSRDGELRVPQGSKKYLAPELIRSEFGKFGPGVDLYSLGFTALELLTGKKFDSLFPGTGEGAIDADVAWLRWHSSDEPMKPVKEIAPGVPDDLAKVIDQLLSKPVADRPVDANAVLTLLDETPLVPVPVIENQVKTPRQQDVKAILPSKAVKLREAKLGKKVTRKPKQNANKKNPSNKKSSKKGSPNENSLNEVLGRPYVLWPICIGILGVAFFVGLQLQGDGTEQPIDQPVAVKQPIASIEKLAVELRVSPDKNGAELSVGGESYVSAPPKFVDVRVVVAPAHASLKMGGQPITLNNGMLRLSPEELNQLELIAEADGYQTLTSRWSLEELAAANFDLQLSLDKQVPPPAQVADSNLPESLVPKEGAKTDGETGLPVRAFVRSLQDTSPLEMALVKAGRYRFGAEENLLRTWELPAQTVEIEHPFYIGINEVSNAQYLAFTSQANVSGVADADESNFPIANLTIQQAAKFCEWAGGQLPSEAQWESAVRGLTDSGHPLPWGNEKLDAQHCRLFRGETQDQNGPVATGALIDGANELGLLDTIGNVAEWCDSQHDNSQFVVKGCSFRIPPGDHVRTSWRNVTKWSGSDDVGMRLMVPVVSQQLPSPALSFVEPSNVKTIFAKADQDDPQKTQPVVYTKTAQELAGEFKGPAELVIDSGGFISEITDVSFSPDGEQVAVGGGKVVRIWDVDSGDLLETLRGDRSRTSYGNVNAVAWSPDGEYLLVGVSDYRDHGNVRVYKTDNLDEISEVLTGHGAPCRKLCFSRDGKQLVSADSDGLTIIRDWNTREILNRVDARDRDKPIYDVMKFATNEPYLIGVDFEGPHVISAMTGKRLGGKDEMPSQVRGWLVDIFNGLVKLPFNAKKEPRVLDFRMEEGRWVGAGSAVSEGRSKFWIRVWQSRNPVASAIPATELGSYDQHRWNVTAVSLQPNGTLVASGDKFGEVHIWDSKTGNRKFKFQGQGRPIYEVAFDEGSSRLAFGVRPHSPKDWKRNNHGIATRVLDLRQRAISDVEFRDNLQLIQEQPSLAGSNVTVRKQDANFLVELLNNAIPQTSYRISSGRNPTAFTLLDQPKLGVEKPVLFGDDEGLFALWDTAGDELKRAFIGHGNLVSAISPASNGKLVATSSTDRTVRLWSLEDYQPTGIFDFKFENSAVREVLPGTSSEKAGVQVGDRIVSIDGKSLTEMFDLMLLGKFDYKPGQVVPVEMKRGQEKYAYKMTLAPGYDFVEPILNFYMGDDGQWIIWHPQGYYDASPGADRLIGWHMNRGFDKSATFFEVQQFQKELYRPDVIDGILETGSLKGALEKLKGDEKDVEDIDFRKPDVIAENFPPSVRITSPVDRWQTETATVKVTGEATSVNGLPLTALTLLHNGSVAKVFRPTEVNQLSMQIEYEMELEAGSNDLVLIAANAKSSSQGQHIVVAFESSQVRRPNATVLAIGVSEFTEKFSPLPSAASDAKAFVDAVQSYQNGQLYGKVSTKLLSQSVSDDEIVEGFQWLADNTKPGDVAMVFIASHAIVDRRDNFYIASTNSVEAKSRSTAVSWRDLMDTLQLDLPDCRRMVFLDLDPSQSAIKPGLRNPLLDLAAPEMGTIFLSANTLQQKTSPASAASQGAFLSAVLKTVGDRKFDTIPKAGDSLFNSTELAAGVMARVKDLTKDQQQPVFFAPEHAKLANLFELRNE